MKNKNIIILSLGFFLLFFGFNGVQQYITSFFDEANLINVGFNSLILIYLFFAISTPLAAIFVSKYGGKTSIILSSLFYSLFIVSLLSKNTILIYGTSSLLGIAAAFLWTGHGSYLIRASENISFGKNAGFFSALFFSGSAIGIFVLGFTIQKYSYPIPFVLFSLFPILALFLFYQLKPLKTIGEIPNRFTLVKKAIKNKTALKLSSIWFSQSFVLGLSLGLIPLTIKNVLGISYISILLPLFYLLPILFSYSFGKLSDKIGRGKIIFYSYTMITAGLLLIYSSGKTALFFGVFLLALSFASMRIVTFALPGDISSDHNLEFLTGLFWLIQNIGTLIALIISRFIQSNTAYLISLAIIILSFIILLSVSKSSLTPQKLSKIKEQLAEEIK